MKKRLAIGSWLGVVWLVLAMLWVPPGEASRTGKALDQVTLQLKWRHQFQFAGYYAAAEKGYYRNAGLEVTIMEAKPAMDPMATVLDGKADFGVGTTKVIPLRAQGKPVVVLSTIFQHSPAILIALKDGGIGSVTDLKGKRAMIEPDDALLFAYLKKEGVPRSSLKLIPHSMGVRDLIDKKVAAMSAYTSDEPFDLKEVGVPFLSFTPRSAGIDFYGDLLFTTEEQIRKHPKRVKSFLEASLKGWKYALDHPQELIDLILTKYRTPKSKEFLEFEAVQIRKAVSPETAKLGTSSSERWKKIADEYANMGMIPRDFSLKGLFYKK